MVSYITIVICITFHSYFIRSIVILLFYIKNTTRITSIVAKGPATLFEMFCLAVPLFMWNRNKEIQNYWTEWENLQVVNKTKVMFYYKYCHFAAENDSLLIKFTVTVRNSNWCTIYIKKENTCENNYICMHFMGHRLCYMVSILCVFQ